jgi:tRNA/rRNA methyltransferase
VQIIAYELRLAYCGAAMPLAKTGRSPAALALSEEIEGLFAHWEQALIALDFFDPANPKKLQPRLRSLFSRANLTRDEVNILRGIAKHILLKFKS